MSATVIQISPGAGKDMSAFDVGGDINRQTVILGDADRNGESDLVELPPHGEVDRGNPLKIGGRASATPLPDLADGLRTDAWFTTNGQLATVNAVQPTVVYDGGRRDLVQFFITYPSLALATVVPGAAGLRTKVMGITAIQNGSIAGTLNWTDGTNTLLVMDYFNPTTTSVTRRFGYGPHMVCQTPVNTGLVVQWPGTATPFWISLLYYQAP